MLEFEIVDREQIEISSRFNEDAKTDKSIVCIKNIYRLSKDYTAAYIIYKRIYECSRMSSLIDDAVFYSPTIKILC